MRWVEVAAIRPHRCAVIPFVGGHDSRGYIDTGSEMEGFDNHIYVSVTAVDAMADLIGRPTISQFREVVTSNQEHAAALAQVIAERDDLKARFDAIDVLAGADFRARKKPGRKAAEKPDKEPVPA